MYMIFTYAGFYIYLSSAQIQLKIFHSIQLTVYITKSCTWSSVKCTACSVQCTVYNVHINSCKCKTRPVLRIRIHWIRKILASLIQIRKNMRIQGVKYQPKIAKKKHFLLLNSNLNCSVNHKEMTWIRIHFFQCRSRIRIRIKIKWILSTAHDITTKDSQRL